MNPAKQRHPSASVMTESNGTITAIPAMNNVMHRRIQPRSDTGNLLIDGRQIMPQLVGE